MRRLSLVVLAFGLAATAPALHGQGPETAQPVPSADSLAQWIRSGYSLSADEGKIPEVNGVVAEVWGELGWSGIGFGFRTLAARRSTPGADTNQGIQSFAAFMEHYRITLDELHTEIVGDIGLAWGFHTEKFKVKGQPPETVRVRFTNTLRWDGKAWRSLLYHRDAQVFDEQGRYIKKPETMP